MFRDRIRNALIRYRPKAWSELAGNQVIKIEFSAMLQGGAVPTGFLITGDYGCGKTTVAQLIARRLCCEVAGGDNLDGCGHCSGCLIDLSPESPIVAEGVFAENCSTMTMARLCSLLDTARYAYPQLVFHFDEAQRAADRIQDRLVTFLEATAENAVVLVSAPTHEHLDEALIQRLHHFEVSPPGPEEVLSLLRRVCEMEGFAHATDELLLHLARLEENVPRRCINALRRCIYRNISELAALNSASGLSI